jgi:hypothetical protein
VISAEEAFSSTWDHEAAALPYIIPGHERIPALAMDAVPWLIENGAEPHLSWIFVDVDNPGHSAWEDGQFEAVLEKLNILPEYGNAGVYQTRHGYRLVWLAPEPIPIRYAKHYLHQFHAYLHSHGIKSDPCPWTTAMRLPHCTLDNGEEPLALYADFSRLGALDWAPSEPLIEDSFVTSKGDFDENTLPEIQPAPRSLYEPLQHCEFYTALIECDPLGPPGTRHNTTKAALGKVAAILKCDDPVHLYRLFHGSMTIGHAPQSSHSEEEILLDLWKLCLWVTDRQRVDNEWLASWMRDSIVQERLGVEVDPDKLKTESGQHEALQVLQKRVVLYKDRGYYVFDEKNKRYRRPTVGTHLPQHLSDYAPTIAPQIRHRTGSLMSVPELVLLYGTPVERLIYRLGERDIWYDADQDTIYEGICGLRSDIKPVYHPEIQQWLELLGGGSKDQLLDWLASVTFLDAPTCALYLHGAKGCGKGFLVEGVSSLWNSTATEFADFVADFNDHLAECPIVWADEKVPPSKYGRTVSATFRTLVGNSQFPLRRKYLPVGNIRGALRFIITANNESALKIDEQLSPEDYDAIVSRIGYVRCDDRAAEYLRQLGGRQHTKLWLDNNWFAEHLLWLRDNRTVKWGPRFIVEGWETAFHKKLRGKWGLNGLALEAICHVIESGNKHEGMFVGSGQILINVPSLQKKWPLLMGLDSRVPSKNNLTNALRHLSIGTARAHRNSGRGRKRFRCWSIRVDEVLQTASDLQIGDPDDFKDRILAAADFVWTNE